MKFNEKCYSLLKKIPRGKVVTYKQIALELGSRGYRAVGNALNKNKTLIKTPCHRVVRSNGFVGNYSQGMNKKIKLLQKEGVEVVNGKINLKKFGYFF